MFHASILAGTNDILRAQHRSTGNAAQVRLEGSWADGGGRLGENVMWSHFQSQQLLTPKPRLNPNHYFIAS